MNIEKRIEKYRRSQSLEELERKWLKAKGRHSNAFWSAEWLDLAHKRAEKLWKWFNKETK